MYQTFPQRRICSSNNAMPVIKPQMNGNFYKEESEQRENGKCVKSVKSAGNMNDFCDNNKSIGFKDEQKCDNIKKAVKCDNEENKECCNEKKLCCAECSEFSDKSPLGRLFGDFFKNMELDDIILIGLILFLLYEGEDNIITIAILALVLFL